MTSTSGSPDPSPTATLPPAKVSCTALPGWIEHQPWPEEVADPQGAWTDHGLLRLLHDSQVSLLQVGIATHLRVVQRVLTRAGAERAAQLVLEFDPSHERLEVHHIRVWRGSDCIEHAPASTAALHLLRRETQLERLALNGRLSATLLVPDVRVDDRVEIALTQYSNNPVLSGRYGSSLVFNSYGPWIEIRQRLLRPLTRKLYLKGFNQPPEPLLSTTDEVEESRWSLTRQERRAPEDLVAPWTVRNPCYQITEFQHWNEIVRIFEPHYACDELPETLGLELDKLAAQYPEDADRAAEWLRFVQRHLRYFALALGEGGLIPRSLEEIWTGRFGDCKDAARLYVAGARRLGLDASAALVSTTHGPGLADLLPSTQPFNHMIVRLRLQGTTYWLDPTLQPQGGRLAKIFLPHAGWALPITPETVELEELPAPQPLEHLRCDDAIRLGPKVDSRATLRRRLELTHWSADNVRHRMENEGGSKLSAQLLQELQGVWPQIAETSPMSVEDNLAENRLTLHFTYEIGDCWKRAQAKGRWEFHLADHFTTKELSQLKVTRRTSEVFLGRPRVVLWRARLEMPRRWYGTGWRKVSGDRGAILRSDLTIDDRSVTMERVLVIDSWTLPAERADVYTGLIADIGRNITQLFARAIFDRVRSPVFGFTRQRTWVVTVIVWWLMMALVSMCNSTGPHR